MHLLKPAIIVGLFILFPSSAIGPGLSRLQPHTPVDEPPDTNNWESSVMPYTNEANSYAYWNCHTIPPNMTLCKSVGYSRMVLPNFLQHESIREVIQQANVWVALVNTDCHPDIQRFLCSLYAPVCLKSHQEAKIPPCWELCEQVRNACLPRMRLFGFDWPKIVQCEQFPRLAESMCIPPQEETAVKCAPCEQAITLENIASSYCMADVVLKASLKDVVLQPNRASFQLIPSQRTQALKLTRSDGTVSTSFDAQRSWKRNRQRRFRQRSLKSRTYRHTDKTVPKQRVHGMHNRVFSNAPGSYLGNWLVRGRRSTPHWNNPFVNQSQIGWSFASSSNGGRSNRVNRRRRAQNSELHELDGITEFQLTCSACSSLPHLTGTSGSSNSLSQQRWLIMGRRILEEDGKRVSNRLQVTFLTIWDRNSPEFRRSLTAIRTQPVSHLCPKKVLLGKTSMSETSDDTGSNRNLKSLRSVSSELADAPIRTHPGRPLLHLEKQTVSYGSSQPLPSKKPTLNAVVNSAVHNGTLSAHNIRRTDNSGTGIRNTARRPNRPSLESEVDRKLTSSIQHSRMTLTPVEQHRPQWNVTQHRPYELAGNRVIPQRWLNAERRAKVQRPHSWNSETEREVAENQRRKWRRERRQWSRRQQPDQLQPQIRQTGGTSVTDLPTHTTLRHQPINPYGNEDNSRYERRSWNR
ncbi:Secreted frizzled protein 1 [Paragonimus heterotremus]|uniref:Secreted frizzled protein 1 n=1 Tax=Paragonimus heterotremus TaxID=100268 RepID=A0A8J4TIP3_9TREM|nr:Secreted frizzled protein 1 [Paragonimus heterotremus]